MNQTAAILPHFTLYWYSIILALAVAAGVCFFMACCSHRKIHSVCAATTALLSVIFSLLFSRMIFWYCRPYSFETWLQALTAPAASCHALLGCFAGCLLAAIVAGRFSGSFPGLMDCMSTAGCGAIALGRLAFFFADGDRGRILKEDVQLPWAYPVLNPSSGLPEYRLATFLFQSIIAGVLFFFLVYLFFQDKKKPKAMKDGSITMLFLMVYSASQVILDSTRYDSLYLQSNGFISLVQLISALTLFVTVVLCSVLAVRSAGVKKWMYIAWLLIPCLFGGAGYMEYFVQRRGKLAGYGYTVMGGFLVGILIIGIRFWRIGIALNTQKRR